MIGLEPIERVIRNVAETPLTIDLDWCKYDLRSSLERWSMAQSGQGLDHYFREHGFEPAGGEAHDGSGVSSLQNRTDDPLESLFPLDPTKRP